MERPANAIRKCPGVKAEMPSFEWLLSCMRGRLLRHDST